jgi:F0F1-type ATP synthase gamma subunit
MKSVRQLKEEIEMNGDLTQLMDVLKGIAATEFWTLARKKVRFTRFMEAYEGFFEFVDVIGADHPFAREQGALALIMVTSNEGFMGGLNTRVINEALSYPGAERAEIIIIGERGAGYLESMGRKFIDFPGIPSGECYEAALRVKDFIMREGRAGRFGRLVLFYPRPLSFMVQKIEQLVILPCTSLFEKKAGGDKPIENIIVESSIDDIIEYLVETWIVQKLFEVFEDSKLAEFSARTVHLEESYQTLIEQGKGLRHQYFGGIHELVDSEMRDIYSAQIVRKKARKRAESEMDA